MTTLSDVRKAILNQVFNATEEGKVNWVFFEDDDSVQADFKTFQIHFDQHMNLAEKSYKIFLLGAENQVVDSYVVRKSTTGAPDVPKFDSYFSAVDSIYRTCEERIKVDELTSYLEKLKKI